MNEQVWAARLQTLTVAQRQQLSRLVAARDDGAEPASNPRLVAYVATDQERFPTAEELRAYLAERLPGYMAPASYIFLDELPRTPNGKVDRRALPDPDDAWMDFDDMLEAEPRNEIEAVIADAWRALLDTPRVSIYDDFFELGGHSLLVTQLVSRLRQRFNVNLPITAVFDARTIAAQAEQVATLQWMRDGDGAKADDVDRETFEL